jgi:hypothetical protein
MKRLLVFLFFTFFKMNYFYSQSKIKGYADFTQNTVQFSWLESRFKIGSGFQLKAGNIFTSIEYVFGGNSPGNVYHEKISAYTMKYHALGGEIKYRGRNLDKIYSPTVLCSFLTDIGSTYRGKYLATAGAITDNSHSVFLNFFPAKTYFSQALSTKNFSYYYISTPIVFDFIFGNEFKIISNLYVNLGVGITMKGISVGFKEWYKGTLEPNSNVSKIYSFNHLKWNTSFNLSFGLNYTFSFKKKDKNTTQN